MSAADGAAGAHLLGPEARSVCVVMLSAVGDSVHVLPLVNALKRHRPELTSARRSRPPPTARLTRA